jgi:Xaa-Pro aminopeptidase
MKKSIKDIESIKSACKVTDATFKHILPHLAEGITEKEIVKKINKYIRKHSDGLAFKTIVAFGENSAEIHHQFPTDRRLMNGDFIMLDFGAKINGLCSDMTRTLFLGKISAKQQALYQAILTAQQKAIEYIESKIKNNELCKAFEADKVARDFLINKKYPPMPHSLGHGIGRNVHSGLRLSPKSKAFLKPGMVFSVEPGLYIKNFGGVRIEDTVLINENKVEILTKSPKEIIIL